jgi:hypothetical protein
MQRIPAGGAYCLGKSSLPSKSSSIPTKSQHINEKGIKIFLESGAISGMQAAKRVNGP